MSGVSERNFNMIFIIHYKKLVERYAYLSKILRGDDVRWVTEYNKENLNPWDISKYYTPNKDDWIKKCAGLYKDIPSYFQLSDGMISCSIAHIKTLELAATQKISIILEDDAFLLCGNFRKEIQKIIDNLPRKWDVIFIGGAFNHEQLSRTIAKVDNYVLKDHPASNTVCAYIVNEKSADILASNMQNFSLPIDFEMNYWMKKNNFNVYHVQPYIIQEGTSAGIYKSSQVRI